MITKFDTVYAVYHGATANKRGDGDRIARNKWIKFNHIYTEYTLWEKVKAFILGIKLQVNHMINKPTRNKGKLVGRYYCTDEDFEKDFTIKKVFTSQVLT